jgi:hypothetical protein
MIRYRIIKRAIVNKQQLPKNPEKLAKIFQATKPEAIR